jgi:prepilin-type processing-associated H-X9-DG protein
MHSDDPDSPVPSDLQAPVGGGIAEHCMDRHQMAVNIAFLDGHAEHVALAGLWNLKWSETYSPHDAVVPRVR